MSKGYLFTIDERYRIEVKSVEKINHLILSDNQFFLDAHEKEVNPNGYLREGEHRVVAKMRRKKVLADLAMLGYFPGCKAPEHAFYLVYGQPNVQNFPESHYYDIEHTFEDMGWEFPGCPHHEPAMLDFNAENHNAKVLAKHYANKVDNDLLIHFMSAKCCVVSEAQAREVMQGFGLMKKLAIDDYHNGLEVEGVVDLKFWMQKLSHIVNGYMRKNGYDFVWDEELNSR
ncbi:hypothetical protein [Marinibactrum halimedae]|uniref:Uncharacterized protein n=1 Tax=Marinibactrum halimedae TaxID=1444977 RepID=A0AA37T3L8_9GAMM|nr:hypothetical protein [Marinibactrum halimedae]MCD9460898.1 hypothetical protein [Marinibactrum halimedae]GLS24572.1 hypothetical protein GCM10007877_02860 [Marinibactrum halimedae]